MPDKRYQIFVSSTYTDLKEERQAVIRTIIELNGIPAGMELFPAVDEEQLSFIKRVIDDCDYYLLIIGGRYGSTSEAGISYTEQEYDYAVSRGLKVIALIHENPDEIPFGKSEQNAEGRIKLQRFREKVSKGRLVKHWKSIHELPGLVALSLTSTISQYPAVGWIRANRAANEDILNEINELRKCNAELEKALSEVDFKPAIHDLAALDELMEIGGQCREPYRGGGRPRGQASWDTKASWREIFGYIAPYLPEFPNATAVKSVLASSLFKRDRHAGDSPVIDDQIFKTISIQLEALGLVKRTYSKSTSGSMAMFWSLTPQGERLMIELRSIRSTKADATTTRF